MCSLPLKHSSGAQNSLRMKPCSSWNGSRPFSSSKSPSSVALLPCYFRQLTSHHQGLVSLILTWVLAIQHQTCADHKPEYLDPPDDEQAEVFLFRFIDLFIFLNYDFGNSIAVNVRYKAIINHIGHSAIVLVDSYSQ